MLVPVQPVPVMVMCTLPAVTTIAMDLPPGGIVMVWSPVSSMASAIVLMWCSVVG